jgi:hypothetical protein
LDKLPEFGARLLEMLRQPLEDKTVSIGRSAGSLTYPASFTLIAAMSPCPGGYFQDTEKERTWSTPAPLSGTAWGDRERPPSEACLSVARVILRLAWQHQPSR